MLLEEGDDPLRVLELCREAMDIVGKRFEKGRVLPARTGAGRRDAREHRRHRQAADQAELRAKSRRSSAKVLIGTVHGDLHDIGKNIVTFMLDINGFEVKDIGIDVPVANVHRRDQRIQARRRRPVRLSHAGVRLDEGDDRRPSRRAGLRDKLKIMIGGGQIDETVRTYTGADAFGINAVEAVTLCKNWMGVAA